jgi:hypothetical protein
MPSLYENLDNAHDGEAMTALGDEFGLTPTQTQAAVTALLPAISTGLKQSTATVDGLGNLFGMMGQQQNLQAMYDDPETAFGRDVEKEHVDNIRVFDRFFGAQRRE